MTGKREIFVGNPHTHKIISKPKIGRKARRRVNNTMFLNGITHLGKQKKTNKNNNQRGSIYEAFVFAHVVKKSRLCRLAGQTIVSLYDIYFCYYTTIKFSYVSANEVY